jgi:hypothetical protein
MSDNIRPAQGTKESSRAHRQQYAAPSLKVFGPVGALTQSGSLGQTENMNNPMANMARP